MNDFNRRDFLKLAGTAAGGLMLSPGMLSAQRKGGDKVNVAIVGYGAEGEVLPHRPHQLRQLMGVPPPM